MSTLVLELRPGDCMVLNGAPIKFRNKTRIELTARARFLFGKQIMAPAEANTPARRIYFALQAAYIGEDAERREGLAEAERLVGEFAEATTSRAAVLILNQALESARNGDCYHALRLARRIVRHEKAALQHAAGAAASGEERHETGVAAVAGGTAAWKQAEQV